MLDKLPPGEAQLLISAARRRRFAAGETLFHEGDLADTLHVIMRGRVAITVSSPYGQQLMFSILSMGEFFGELALLSTNHLRTATARALEPTETLSIHRNEFDRLRHEHPQVEELLIGLLAARVQRLSEQLRDALYLSVELRIRRRILALTELYGQGNPGTVIPLTQDELAELSGTARATVNRVLRNEQNLGSVRLGRHRIVVTDPEALSRRAGPQ